MLSSTPQSLILIFELLNMFLDLLQLYHTLPNLLDVNFISKLLTLQTSSSFRQNQEYQ